MDHFEEDHTEAGQTGADHTETDHAETDQTEAETEVSRRDEAQNGHGFRHWRRQRPFISGLLVVLGGIELFFSSQLDTGNLQIQFGIEGLQATVIPIALAALGLFAIFRPTHHMFYGIIALVLAVYSLIGVNLGGFIVGMLLSSIGSVLVVAWMGPRGPKKPAAEEPRSERRGDGESSGQERST